MSSRFYLVWIYAALAANLLLSTACSDSSTGPSSPAVSSIRILNANAELMLGASDTLTAVPLAADGRTLATRPVAFTALTPSIVTVSPAGIVTATAPVTAIVRNSLGEEFPERGIAWSALHPSIALREAGVIRGLADGTARFRVSADTLEAFLTVIVSTPVGADLLFSEILSGESLPRIFRTDFAGSPVGVPVGRSRGLRTARFRGPLDIG